MKEKTYDPHRFWRWLWQYATYFVLICFVSTCSLMLFLHNLELEKIIDTDLEGLRRAATLTFYNVILLSMLFALGDMARRHFTVDRPVNKICSAAEQLMRGDLTVRIEPEKIIAPNEGYNLVIQYFNQMAEELSGMETLRTDFIANVSHELKTPLAVMQNYGTMLKMPNLPEEKRLEYAGAITDASRSLANMVTNILKLNKLENQSIYPAVEAYDLGEQLCECFLGFESLWEKKNINIETDLAENVLVTADPELLELVWNNLFSNAFKFTEEGGTVSLRLTEDGGTARVEVADTGCGISPETGKHIFEKFYQGDTSHATKGNGLGLALVKRVVDITGGSISVSSVVGKGSTFTVSLQCEQHAAAS